MLRRREAEESLRLKAQREARMRGDEAVQRAFAVRRGRTTAEHFAAWAKQSVESQNRTNDVLNDMRKRMGLEPININIYLPDGRTLTKVVKKNEQRGGYNKGDATSFVKTKLKETG
jgi:hypothetical protein